MQQLVEVWSALSPRRRLVVGLATLAVFASVLLLSRIATRPDMALLYAGLEPARAGEVVAAVEQRGVGYEVRGDSIYVPADQRDGLRMALAAEGLPANSGAGYELLDQLSGFGTTSQMFDAAYLRAKEGELARTIVSDGRFRGARVHIAMPGHGTYGRDRSTSASVTVTAAAGAVGIEQARALRFLVASAVQGLDPANVSIIDTATGTIVSAEDAAGLEGSQDRAEMLRRNVERLLEARVGPGRAVVEVSIERVTEHESITERRFDPESRVAISTDTEERSTAAKNGGEAALTVASNLPEGNPVRDGGSESQNSETRERINFEVSETQREILRAPGALRRITVAVLVDGLQQVDASGAEVWTVRPEEELSALRDLVASAVGYDEQRGDVITLKSMPFVSAADTGTSAPAGLLANANISPMALIQLGVLAIVALALGLFVLRPLLVRGAPASRAVVPAPVTPPQLSTAQTELRVLSGEIEDGDSPVRQMPMIQRTAGSADDRDPSADPVTRLRRLIEERQRETAEILRTWMEDHEEKA